MLGRSCLSSPGVHVSVAGGGSGSSGPASSCCCHMASAHGSHTSAGSSLGRLGIPQLPQNFMPLRGVGVLDSFASHSSHFTSGGLLSRTRFSHSPPQNLNPRGGGICWGGRRRLTSHPPVTLQSATGQAISQINFRQSQSNRLCLGVGGSDVPRRRCFKGALGSPFFPSLLPLLSLS